jgi:hypothetical protein
MPRLPRGRSRPGNEAQPRGSTLEVRKGNRVQRNEEAVQSSLAFVIARKTIAIAPLTIPFLFGNGSLIFGNTSRTSCPKQGMPPISRTGGMPRWLRRVTTELSWPLPCSRNMPDARDGNPLPGRSGGGVEALPRRRHDAPPVTLPIARWWYLAGPGSVLNCDQNQIANTVKRNGQ